MLLIVDQSTKEISTLNSEIDALKQDLQQNLPQEAFEKNLKEMDISLKTFTDKLKEFKSKKFERDARDYSQARVYKWLHQSIIPKKKVTWRKPISDSEFDTTDSEGTGSSSEDRPGRPYQFRNTRMRQQPFLEQRRKSSRRHKT